MLQLFFIFWGHVFCMASPPSQEVTEGHACRAARLTVINIGQLLEGVNMLESNTWVCQRHAYK